jgi:hypothetical protein
VYRIYDALLRYWKVLRPGGTRHALQRRVGDRCRCTGRGIHRKLRLLTADLLARAHDLLLGGRGDHHESLAPVED